MRILIALFGIVCSLVFQVWLFTKETHSTDWRVPGLSASLTSLCDVSILDELLWKNTGKISLIGQIEDLTKSVFNQLFLLPPLERYPPPPIAATIGESLNIQAALTNDADGECEFRVRLNAPAFDYEPKDTRTYLVQNRSREIASWLAVPKSLGKQIVTVSNKNSDYSTTIEVINLLGLTITQATVLSYLSAFLGSALTLPWLLERIRLKAKTAA